MSELELTQAFGDGEKILTAWETDMGSMLVLSISPGRAHKQQSSENIGYHLEPTQRRALLAHLLAAEGLPGVEEIERLTEQVREESLLQIGAQFRDELAELRRVVADLYEWGQRMREVPFSDPDWGEFEGLIARQWTPEARRQTLHELLEAEARERVEVTDRYGDGELQFSIGEESEFALTPEGEIEPRFDTGYRLLDLLLCETAALAEKRRREQGDGGDNCAENQGLQRRELFTCRRCRRRFFAMEGSVCPDCDDNMSDLVESEVSDV